MSIDSDAFLEYYRATVQYAAAREHLERLLAGGNTEDVTIARVTLNLQMAKLRVSAAEGVIKAQIEKTPENHRTDADWELLNEFASCPTYEI